MRSFIAAMVFGILAAAPVAAQPSGQGLEVNIFHSPVCLMSKDLDVGIWIYNDFLEPQSYKGEAVNAAGELVLTGAWDLIFEEVKEDKVVSSRSLRPANAGEGSIHQLDAHKGLNWKLQSPWRN